MTNTDAFRDWAMGQGGLNEASARSYASYLNSIEEKLGIDISGDWNRSKLQMTYEHLANDTVIDPKTKSNYLSGLRKYEEFRSLMSA